MKIPRREYSPGLKTGLVAALFGFIAIAGVACGSEQSEPIVAEATIPTTLETSIPVVAEETSTTQEPVLPPTIEVTYFAVNESDVARFVAEITNNADETLVGLKTEWIAFNSNEVIIGSFVREQPPIPPRGTLNYVGGAGGLNLTGTPARIEVTVTEVGRFVAETALPYLLVEDVQVNASQFSSGYDNVTATVTAPENGVWKDEIQTSLVIRDAEGVVTYADFISDIAGPEQFPADSRFAVSFSLLGYDGPVDNIEIQVYVD